MNFSIILRNIALNSEFQTFIKLALSALLAGIMGYERENKNKPAGFRTYVLVGMSAAMVMICGEYFHERTGADASRIPAQLLSGIGFLGAGTILRDGNKVKGLTTAAGLLAVACIGLSVGAGYYLGAMMACVIAYLILTYSYKFSNKLEHYTNMSFKIITNEPKNIMNKIEEIIKNYDFTINKIKLIEEDEESDINYIIVEGRCNENIDRNKLMSDIISLEKVKQVVEV